METFRPRDLGELLEAAAQRPDADFLAGGTDLMVDVNLAHHRPAAVIALRRVSELQERDRRFIGAGVTFAHLERGPHQALAELARTVGSPQIRAAGTIGGNLGTASPAGDSLPWLAAIEAGVVLASTRGRRTMPVAEFLTGPKHNACADDEVIVGVELPERMPESEAFAKVGVRQAMVIATVSCCAVRYDDGTVRVALGAVGPTVLRAATAERYLQEKRGDITDDVKAEFARLVAGDVSPITDHRSTADYRRHAAGVLARRTLERVL
jgi:CO/xanthine dehydrogenase FAD-binding subunit